MRQYAAFLWRYLAPQRGGGDGPLVSWRYLAPGSGAPGGAAVCGCRAGRGAFVPAGQDCPFVPGSHGGSPGGEGAGGLRLRAGGLDGDQRLAARPGGPRTGAGRDVSQGADPRRADRTSRRGCGRPGGLDGETERRIWERTRATDKTYLVVSNRPGALARADQVIYLDNGRISIIQNEWFNVFRIVL